MSQETYDPHINEPEDIQNIAYWGSNRLLENNLDSKVKVNQEIKELQRNIFLKFSLKLWLINLLCYGRILEDQFNDMIEDYDRIIIELINRRKVVLLTNNEELITLNTALSKSNIFLAEVEKRYEISDIFEEEYLVKKRKFEWEITHYKNELLKRTDVISFLENPHNTISVKKYNDMKQEANRCLENINNLKQSDNISSNTQKKIKISMEKLVEHLREYNYDQQKQLDSIESDEPIENIKQNKQSIITSEHDARDTTLELLDSLDFDEVNIEIKRPISSELSDEHNARDHLKEREPETEEIIEEDRLLRVECPYFDMNGKKCKVVAFSTNKAEAYQKLRDHVIENHPDKIEEFTDIIRKKKWEMI